MSIPAPPTRSCAPSSSQGREGSTSEEYTPFGHSTTRPSSPTSKKFSPGKQDGRGLDHQRRLQRAVLQGTGQPGIKAKDVPVVAFSVGEEELRGVDANRWSATWPPGTISQSIKNPANDGSSRSGAPTPRPRTSRPQDKPLTNDPMEATYIGVNMWAGGREGQAPTWTR